MKVCFRPFGVGFEDVDTEDIKRHVASAVKKTKEVTGKVISKTKPVAITVTDDVLKYTVLGARYTADAAVMAADGLQGLRDRFKAAIR